MCKEITLVGTGHVFRLREKIRKLICDLKPKAVCVELDEKRYRALTRNEISLHPLALVQRIIAHVHGTIPGNDMLGGIEGARDIGAHLFLIDENIYEIRRRLMETIPSEFFNPLEILRKISIFPIVFLSQPLLAGFEKAIREFESHPEKYRRSLGQIFPHFKKILLDEREAHMANKINEVAERFDLVVAVVGAGHVAGLKEILGYKVRTIGLVELLNM